MGYAKAKSDIRMLMEDGIFSNFIQGNIYRFKMEFAEDLLLLIQKMKQERKYL